jgi:hypothetical protein
LAEDRGQKTDFELDLELVEVEFEKDMSFLDRMMGSDTRPFEQEPQSEENQRAFYELALQDPNIMAKLTEEQGEQGIKDWMEHMGNTQVTEALNVPPA